MSKDCTSNILREYVPVRGAMPCIETFSERKVHRSPDDTEIRSAFKNDPLAFISALFPSILFRDFLPPSSTWHWVTSPRTHATQRFLWLNWKLNPKHTESKFSAYNLMLDWCHKSFCTHSPFILSLKGVERSQWSCVEECVAGNSHLHFHKFSIFTHTHTHTHGAFLWITMHLWFKRSPTDIHIKEPCVQKHMRSFPLEQNIFLS